MRYQKRRYERREEQADTKFKSEVLFINRVAKVLKGGRRFRFTALVVVGDGEGSVGLGLGKAPEVVEAIRKGEELAKKNMIQAYRVGTTVPFEVKHHYCATTVVLRPAREGAGITAGGPARTLLTLAGVTDCTAKFFGSNNRVNCARATFEALKAIEEPKITLKFRRDRSFHIAADSAAEQKTEQKKAAKPTAVTSPERAAPETTKAVPAGVPQAVSTAKPEQKPVAEDEPVVETELTVEEEE